MQIKKQTKKICLTSLGCSKNLVDSEIMLGILDDKGYELITSRSDADVLIVNTCAFIGDAREESVEAILDLAEHKKTGRCKSLIVTGCLSQRYSDELLKELPEVDYFVGTGEYPRIAEILDSSPEEKVFVNTPTYVHDSTTPRRISTPSHYAYVKLAEGCSNHCTYCAIPAIRGEFRSRPARAVLDEIKNLADAGVKEINLIAQDTTSYGTDLNDTDIADILKQIADPDVSRGIEWIRLLYLYPARVSDELIKTIRDEPKICPYLDLPIQHISDRVLGAMNRRYSKQDVTTFIEKARAEIVGVVLRTSLITGFPGETEEEFEELLGFIKDVQFDRLGAFKYSQEQDTPASLLKPQISDDIKENRLARIMNAQEDISLERNMQLVGKTLDVLIEGHSDDGEGGNTYVGRTQGQAPDVDGVTYVVTTSADLNPGDIIKTTITHATEHDLIGEAVA